MHFVVKSHQYSKMELLHYQSSWNKNLQPYIGKGQHGYEWIRSIKFRGNDKFNKMEKSHLRSVREKSNKKAKKGKSR